MHFIWYARHIFTHLFERYQYKEDDSVAQKMYISYLHTESNPRQGLLAASGGSPIQLNVVCHMIL